MSAHGELICGNFGDCVNLPGGYRCDCREGSGLQVNYSSLILNQYKRKFLMNLTRGYFKIFYFTFTDVRYVSFLQLDF